MFSLSVLLLWYRRFILAPLGLSAPVKLYHNAGSRNLTKSDSSKTLLDVLKTGCPSLLGDRAWYTPTWWLFGSGHLQTLYSALGNFTEVHKVEYERKFLAVPDGGVICLDITPPLRDEAPDNRPILVCMHGLTGGSHESYIRSVLSVLCKPVEDGGKGWRGIVVTSRGSADSPLKTPKLYHMGAIYDLKTACLYIAHLFPDAAVYGAGFSLGAGMITRYLGTEADTTQIKSGIAVGAPWHMREGHIRLQSSMLGLTYSKAMATNLQRIVRKHEKVLRTHPTVEVDAVLDNPHMTLYEFDSIVTSVCGGFDSTEHYYRAMSPKNFVDGIKVPFLALNAMDDPIAAAKGIPFDAVERNPNLVFAATKHGGHLGWYRGTFSFLTKDRWVTDPIVEWLEAIHAADPSPRVNSALVGKGRPKKPQKGDEMVVDPNDPDCGFQEVGEDEKVVGGDAKGEQSLLSQGL